MVDLSGMWWVSSEPGEGSRLRGMLRQALRYGAVVPVIAGSTLVAELFYRITGSDRLSSIFIAGVLLAAFLLGSGPAYVAAILAFTVYLFLVDPRFQFTFGSADDFNVLMMFLVVSGLTGLLTGRVRDEASRAKARQRVNGALLDATQEFSASSDETFIRRRLAHHLARAARGEAAVAEGARVQLAPGPMQDPTFAELLLAAEAANDLDDRATRQSGGWSVRALRAGDTPLGITVWRPRGGGALSDEEQTVVEILADTGAAAISRARLAAEKAEAEARARTEDLRNALLSSISHDLRTPLAAILASATSLQEFGASFDGETREDLLATIREEAERLDRIVANLLNMSRLEAGALTIRTSAFNVPEVVQRTAERCNRAEKRSLSLIVDPRTPEALGDPVLFEQALGNVLENALRYSPPDTPLGIVVRGGESVVEVEVWDEGGGVPEAETDLIFQKFFRSAATQQLPGTGLGLSIAHGLLVAMGGWASAKNRDDGVRGLVVRLCLRSAAA